MRRIIFSVATVALIAASVSIGSRIQASSHPNTASVAGTLSSQEFMVRFGKDLPVEPDIAKNIDGEKREAA